MLNALRLYADNLLCMDLCGWSGVDAIKLLGEEVTHSVYSSGACVSGLVHPVQKVHSLRRRKEMGEIWGCRHMVEARHGISVHISFDRFTMAHTYLYAIHRSSSKWYSLSEKSTLQGIQKHHTRCELATTLGSTCMMEFACFVFRCVFVSTTSTLLSTSLRLLKSTCTPA